jgi:hypothetical protein
MVCRTIASEGHAQEENSNQNFAMERKLKPLVY